MAEDCIIAYCNIARQYYRLTLRNDTKTVSDFTLCSDLSGCSREITARLITDGSLRPCPVCGSRAVGQCDCMRLAMPCEPFVGFRFSCIYCRNLRLLDTFSGQQGDVSV